MTAQKYRASVVRLCHPLFLACPNGCLGVRIDGLRSKVFLVIHHVGIAVTSALYTLISVVCHSGPPAGQCLGWQSKDMHSMCSYVHTNCSYLASCNH